MSDQHKRSGSLAAPVAVPLMMKTKTTVNYVGRFAPSPTGPLHAGSLVAALASYLDARCHHGTWLLRIEDVDETRAVPGAAEDIMQTLLALGMQWDGEVVWQSRRSPLYETACKRLQRLVYPCACTRSEIADSRLRTVKAAQTGSSAEHARDTRRTAVAASAVAADGAVIYPGTCRHGLAQGRSPRVLRVRVPDQGNTAGLIAFTDRWQGPMSQSLANDVGDFVVRRADGFWAYQMAVVVDDAEQGVTDVVRGADLLDSTARQIYLQRALSVPTPRYLHVPAVTNDRGEKLSKQTGAAAIDSRRPLEELKKAARFLGLEIQTTAPQQHFWESAVTQWGRRFAVVA